MRGTLKCAESQTNSIKVREEGKIIKKEILTEIRQRPNDVGGLRVDGVTRGREKKDNLLP